MLNDDSPKTAFRKNQPEIDAMTRNDFPLSLVEVVGASAEAEAFAETMRFLLGLRASTWSAPETRAERPTAPVERKDAPARRTAEDAEEFVDAVEARTATTEGDDLADDADLVRGTARRAELAPSASIVKNFD